jgi:hypothetical protein
VLQTWHFARDKVTDDERFSFVSLNSFYFVKARLVPATVVCYKAKLLQ